MELKLRRTRHHPTHSLQVDLKHLSNSIGNDLGLRCTPQSVRSQSNPKNGKSRVKHDSAKGNNQVHSPSDSAAAFMPYSDSSTKRSTGVDINRLGKNH